MASSRLDTFLVDRGHYESRARAASAIKAGKVVIDGKIATKPSQKVSEHQNIKAENEHPWVSRGGLKLAHALKVFGIDPKNQICLDVGSSTGGFTEVLLAGGAAKIYAVDVGRDQLHKRLRGNDKIISLESTDARNLTADLFAPLPDFIVCDASFISAAKVLKRPLELAEPCCELMTLIKPQFEVGKTNIGKGGLVKDQSIAKQSLDDFSVWLEGQGWTVILTDTSPIKGGDGNTEYLLHARKK